MSFFKNHFGQPVDNLKIRTNHNRLLLQKKHSKPKKGLVFVALFFFFFEKKGSLSIPKAFETGTSEFQRQGIRVGIFLWCRRFHSGSSSRFLLQRSLSSEGHCCVY